MYGLDKNELFWSYPADGGSAIKGYKVSRWAYHPVIQTGEKVEIDLAADSLTHVDQDINRSREYSYIIAFVNINGVGPIVFINDRMPSSESNSLIYHGAILAGIWVLVIVIVVWEKRRRHSGEQP